METFRPFFELNRIQNEIDRLFEHLSELHEGEDPVTAWTPNVDIYEGVGDLVLKFELPDVDPGSVQLSVNGNNIILRGNKPRTAGSAPSSGSSGWALPSIPTRPGPSTGTGCSR